MKILFFTLITILVFAVLILLILTIISFVMRNIDLSGEDELKDLGYNIKN